MSDEAVKLGADAIAFYFLRYTIFVAAKTNFLCRVIEFWSCSYETGDTVNNLRVILGAFPRYLCVVHKEEIHVCRDL